MKKIIFVLLILHSIFAHAVDGVIEINQACAVNTGCFSGDAAGFPVTIDGVVGKSYQLTSDLFSPDNFTIGVQIITDNIALDLNGFSIIGPDCVANATNCRPTDGSGAFGIHSTKSGSVVKNGSIIGMAGTGVLLGDYSRIENLTVQWCKSIGIQFKSHSIITNNIAAHNGSHGMHTIGQGSHIKNNTATGNVQNGITTSSLAKNNSIIANIIIDNGGTGILTADFSLIQNNQVLSNTAIGISARNNCDVNNNTIHNSGSTGLFVADRSKVYQNTITESIGVGLSISGSFTVYQNNYMHNNQSSVSGGVNLGENFCHNQICP